MSKLIVKFNDDGTVSLDARGMKGKDSEILKDLNSLAASVGGDLKVEKHVGKHHHHHGEGHHIHN